MSYKYNVFTDNLDIVDATESAYPKYYIAGSITVGSYGQYVIHETGYLEIVGSIDLDEGAMIIIEQGA